MVIGWFFWMDFMAKLCFRGKLKKEKEEKFSKNKFFQ
jgi:hypothetical protein